MRREDMVVHNAKHKNINYYNDFCRLLKNFGDYSYFAYIDTFGYFDSFGEAELAVRMNAADFNEAGVNPYAAVVRMPLGSMYPECYQELTDVTLYQYERENDRYVPFDGDKRFADFLKHKLTGRL